MKKFLFLTLLSFSFLVGFSQGPQATFAFTADCNQTISANFPLVLHAVLSDPSGLKSVTWAQPTTAKQVLTLGTQVINTIGGAVIVTVPVTGLKVGVYPFAITGIAKSGLGTTVYDTVTVIAVPKTLLKVVTTSYYSDSTTSSTTQQ